MSSQLSIHSQIPNSGDNLIKLFRNKLECSSLASLSSLV